jgi:hypothetical protein
VKECRHARDKLEARKAGFKHAKSNPEATTRCRPCLALYCGPCVILHVVLVYRMQTVYFRYPNLIAALIVMCRCNK